METDRNRNIYISCEPRIRPNMTYESICDVLITHRITTSAVIGLLV